MLLYLTRHGETDYNVLGRYCGSTDVPLNETGIEQAIGLSKRLQGMAFDAIISSPMLRAKQTADIVCKALNMQYNTYEQFAERNVGVYEGLTRDEAKERYPDLWDRQCTSKPDDAPDGGETLRGACARIDNGMKQLLYEFSNETVLVICHGFTARAVHRFCRDLSFEEMSGFVLKNCEVATYILEDKVQR